MLNEQRVELVLGAVQARLDDHRRHGRPDAAARVDRLLGSERWRALLTDLGRLPERSVTGSTDDARRRLRKDWRRMRRRAVVAAHTVGDERAHEAALHEVRKAAKRARYAAETLGPMFGDDAARMEKAAEAVQQTLGDHRDTLLTREVLRGLGGSPPTSTGTTASRSAGCTRSRQAAGAAALGAYEERARGRRAPQAPPLAALSDPRRLGPANPLSSATGGRRVAGRR